MARKSEEGLQYFPVNTDIVSHPKIKLVVAEFGPRAWALLLPLLCKIHRGKGYWLDWLDEDSKLLFVKDECGLEVPFANEIVSGLVRRGFFNKTVFDLFGVLTSDRIQENYMEAKKRNKSIEIIGEFLLINVNDYNNGENVNIVRLNVNIISKNVDTGTQNRIEEKKRKENTLERVLSEKHESQEKYKSLEKTKSSIIEFLQADKPKFITPYVDVWNIYAQERKKAKVKTVTDMRLKKFNIRVNEPSFDFLAILSKAKDSEFLMTRSFFTFDWIIENQDNYIQILEGKYDNNKTPKSSEQPRIDTAEYRKKRQQQEERARKLSQS